MMFETSLNQTFASCEYVLDQNQLAGKKESISCYQTQTCLSEGCTDTPIVDIVFFCYCNNIFGLLGRTILTATSVCPRILWTHWWDVVVNPLPNIAFTCKQSHVTGFQLNLSAIQALSRQARDRRDSLTSDCICNTLFSIPITKYQWNPHENVVIVWW